MQIIQENVDLMTPTGLMRCYIYRPINTGKFPAVIFYSEIFQQTAPIARSAAMIASHGFLVLVPEVFHELNPIGTFMRDEGERYDGALALQMYQQAVALFLRALRKN